ncbi:MAG: PQQ-like beta-propeller repeat protein [Thermoanaerobaculia bacterium]|nr:PQQ-like beta-propeller repeat protein [Thermoanaerobaculia bacterium]
MQYLSIGRRALTSALALLALSVPSLAQEWPSWRGPDGNSVSRAQGLIDSWSTTGENLLWRQDFTGRSAPVVMQGRVCANGRAGEELIDRQEMVACFDAFDGTKLWEFRFNVYQTTVPWNRVGWANLAGDAETGYLFVQGVGGLFYCLDSKDGSVVWEKNLIEEYGFMEGYGGRTQTPTVDENRVIVTFASTNWGEESRPLHRMYAFDKKNGDLLWRSSPANSMADKNAQSTAAIATIDGRRLAIHGNGDGSIFAVDARTGEKVWGFKLSKRAINISVVVDGTTVYASHSEENVDEGSMGRVVAIDATGSGDVTKTHEIWRSPLGAGFSSLVAHDGKLYVVDNSANLHALDATNGHELWELDLGNVGKGSPVWADGKLYVTEVNGHFLIVGLDEEGGRILDNEEINMPEGRFAEVYGSPAIAYNRIYFTTEEGLYALGSKTADRKVPALAAGQAIEAAADDAKVATVQVIPGDIHLRNDESASFRVELFDAKGRRISKTDSANWTLDGLQGTLSPDGTFTPDPKAGSQTGKVIAKVGEVLGSARLRVLTGLPIHEDFESTEVGSRPNYFIGYVGRWGVEELEGVEGHVLAKNPSPVKIHRHITFLGDSGDHDYTIEADLMGTKTGRKVADMGLLAQGYTLDLKGAQQTLDLYSWASALRMKQSVDFAWEPGVWYRVKMQVENRGEHAIVRAKAWKRGTAEPDAWTLEVDDPHGIAKGSPGLYGFSPSSIYYDNVSVTPLRTQP